MTITKRITTVQEVPIEVTLPYYTKEFRTYTMITEQREGRLRGIQVYTGVDSEAMSITTTICDSDLQKGLPIDADEFWNAYETAKERLNKKEFLCKAAAIDAGHDPEKTVMELDGPVTIDTEREQEYQPKSKLYQGMKNGNVITSPSRKIQVGYHEGQSITYTEEINIPAGEDSLERDVYVERTGIIRFNEQTGIYFIEAEDGDEIPLEDV